MGENQLLRTDAGPVTSMRARAVSGPQPAVKPPLLRPAVLADFPAIAALQEANGLRSKPREEWEHLWTDNPAVREHPGWIIGWVLEDDRGRIVGSIGNIPFTYHLNARKYLGTAACGWAVDPAYRGFSILLLSKLLQQPGVDLQVTTTPGPVTATLFARLGFTPPPAGQWNRAALWVVNIPGLHGSRSRARAWPSKRLRTGIELRCGSEFDAAFDEFWEARVRSSRLLLASRSRAALDWHFKYAIRQDRIRVIGAYLGSRLVAYAILQRRDTQQWSLNRMRLVDYQELDPGTELCRSIILYALQCCRREGIHVLENAGCWIEQPSFLDRTAPFHRPLNCWTYLYKAPNPALRSALLCPVHWHPTQYDGDACL
jgi:hypothetical protein